MTTDVDTHAEEPQPGLHPGLTPWVTSPDLIARLHATTIPLDLLAEKAGVSVPVIERARYGAKVRYAEYAALLSALTAHELDEAMATARTLRRRRGLRREPRPAS